MAVSDAWQTGGGDLTSTIRGLMNGSSYDVQVAATNGIGTSLWSATTSGTPFTANNPPEFPVRETGARNVKEDAAVAANIGAPVRANDPDSRTLLYALETDSDYISINERTGQLRVKAALDYEFAQAHVVTVTVSDLANANAMPNEVVDAEIEVTIAVGNVNEPPVVSGEAVIEVEENSTGVLATYSAADPEGDTITEWSLGGSDAGDFTIDSDGRLRFANPPDFDSPTDLEGDNEYRVRVRAKDVRRVGRFDVVVTVTGIDEAPVIVEGESTVEFAENARTAIDTYTATDPEGQQTYWQALSGADAALFQLTGSGELRFVNPPDYESPAGSGGDNTYQVILTAADREENGETSTLTVTVNVTPVDEPPAIDGEQVPNFLEGGTDAVATYTVSDPEGERTMFTWGLAGPDRALFNLTANGASATLAFKTPPDFETPAGSRRNNEYVVTIEVTDEATHKGTSGVLVTVRNDNDPPTLTGGPDMITVAEDVTGTIATYTATDPERAPIVWSVEGTDGEDFAINEMGQLSFAIRADAETQTSHSITVVASDGDPTSPLTARRDVTATVTSVDEPPEISPVADIVWNENATGSVATFTATDPEGQQTAYTFTLEGEDAGAFTLTPAGVLSFRNPPDYEAPSDDADRDGVAGDNDYLITIKADDGPAGDDPGSLDLTVTVEDVNEPPAITPTGNITRVENSTGTVADYAAADPEGVTDTFKWSLAGDDADDFILHEETGFLTLRTPPDYDNPTDADEDNVYLLTIEVTDGDLRGSINVEMTVTNVNEPPVVSGDAAITKTENFDDTLDTYTAEDQEGVTAFVWSLDGTDKDDLVINASTGALSFKIPPDYDNPLDSRNDGSFNTYNVIVRATEPDDRNSQTTELAASLEVLISVTNIDEVSVIKGPTNVTDFPENSPATREVGRYSISDPEGERVTWSALSGNDAASFTLSSGGVLTFGKPPDHESKETYSVTLNASDGKNSGTLDVTVTVTDVNEAPVVARETGTGAFSIVENSGTAVGTFVAPDPEDDNVEWTVAGIDGGHFEISQSGELSFEANPDHDAPLDSRADGTSNTYNVIVRATEEDDQHSQTRELTVSLDVLVRVTGVNEAPVIDAPLTVTNGSIDHAENRTNNTVATFTASDPEDKTVVWELGGDDAGPFTLGNGTLSFVAPPNFEDAQDTGQDNTYQVQIRASDGSAVGTYDLMVRVTNVNEAPVVARETGMGAFSVVENSGMAVGTFVAPDPEDDNVEWTVAGIDGGRFQISGSGSLSFKANPDYDNPLDSRADGTSNTYNVIVRATEEDDQDSQTRELTGSLDVLVRVTDVNEAPVVTPPSAITGGSIDHAENRRNNTVATFTVSDPDRQTVVWQALAGGDAGDFTFINGTLSFVVPPNFEDAQDTGGDNTYNVIIRASDGSTVSAYDLAVRVTNVDERGRLTLSSTQPLTETALTATLTDPDVVGVTTWAWERSKPGGWDSLGETDNSYTPVAGDDGRYLRVTASYADGHGSGKSLTATSSNAVQLRPPDNTAPDFGSTSATRSVQENSAADTDVGLAVSASDTENAGDLAYTLTGSPLFTIVSTSGQIKVATGAVINREADAQHTVTVTATDPSGLTDTISVTIDVTDVNEPPTAGPDTVSTSEDRAVTFGVLANDSDPETEKTNLIVSLGSTRPSIGSVTLDATAKQFTYTPKQDLHGADSFTYTLSDGTHRATGTVNVSVTSVNDLPDFGPTSTERSVRENAMVGDTVGAAVVATDRDHPTLSYSLSGAADFSIDEGTGQIRVARALNHENTPSYTATVTVKDGDSDTATIQVTIAVTNVNEPPIAADYEDVAVEEDMAVTVDVLDEVTDPDTVKADLTVSLVSTRYTWGTAAVDPVTKEITYRPNANAHGVEIFDYRVTDDGRNSDVGTVKVTIMEVNDAPVFEQDPSPQRLPLSVREGVEEGFNVGTPVTATDPDEDPLTYSLSGASDFTIDQVTAQISVAADVIIDRERIETYDATVTASDGRGESDTILIRITVSDVPEPPVVTDHEVTAVEDTPLTINVLTGVMDPDTDLALLTVRVTTQPSYGQAEVESDKTVTYRPDLDSNNQDSFGYQVSDGRNADEGFVYITAVQPVNDAPTYVSGEVAFEISEDSEPGDDVGYALTALDVDGDTPTYSLTGSADFGIDAASGQIATVNYLDAIATPTHTVTITATESATPALTATIAVTITVVIGEAATVTPPTPGGGGGGGGSGGGGPSGPTPSELDFEWTVTRDIEELDGGHDKPSGAWSDGATLWVLENGDGADDAIYAYDLESGERAEGREFKLDETNRAPRGVWSDRTVLWVSDSGRNRLFAHDLATGERLPERDIAFAERNRAARGIWSDEETMWVLDGGKDSLFAYDLATGELLAEYALDPTNDDPHGIWSDRVTVWVSNHDPKHLFAYRLPAPEGPAAEDAEPQALERVGDEEFGELSNASNNSPRGIWSDGEVMYVADESDARVYTYTMPDAIDARLASLTLSGVDIGEFSPNHEEYEGAAGEGLRETTVAAEALQLRADVDIDPPDADGEADGHQVALDGLTEITVTVTSADGSRTKVYRMRVGGAGPSASCLRGATAEGFSLVVSEGGSVGDLVACAESRGVTALYTLSSSEWVSYIIGAPASVNAGFGGLFAEGIPALTPLAVRSESPVEAPPAAPAPDGDAWPVCLRGAIAEGFSLTVYEGGSVEDLDACAERLGVVAIYVLAGSEWVPYIPGAPGFVNAAFRELFPDGVPAATPLTVGRAGT